MTWIRFLRDFQGRATREIFYRAGEIVDLETAAEVVAEGAAEYMKTPPPPKPAPRPKRPRKKKAE